MSSVTESIISRLIGGVDGYNLYCDDVLSENAAFQKIELNLHNERTIAHFFDIRLQDLLDQQSLHSGVASNYLLISECLMHYLISSAGKITADSEIDIGKNKNVDKYKSMTHANYVPDTVIIERGEVTTLYCIEYKVEDRFSICKLVLDYLKYKYYSSGFGCRSVFIYVLFYKNSGKLELRGAARLPKLLKGKTRTQKESIFVFDPWSTSLPVLSVDAIHLIMETSKNISQIEELTSDHTDNNYHLSQISLEENVFYRNRNKFNPNVISAVVIRKNYGIIYEMAQRIANNKNIMPYGMVSDYNIDPGKIFSPEFSDEDCIAVARHFDRQIKKFLADDVENVPEILTVHKKRTAWILIMLQEFAKRSGWNDLADGFHMEVKEDIATEYQERLRSAYTNRSENFNKLCLGLICYIVNLYPAIFQITSQNIVMGFNQEYLKLKNKSDVDKSLCQLVKELGLKTRKKISIDNEDFIEELLRLIFNENDECVMTKKT